MTLHFANLSETACKAELAPRAVRGLYRTSFKRIFETILVLLALPLVLPLVAVLALMVAADGNNPFYAQPRIGRDGRVFRLWKLRTMVVNADAYLATYLAENPEAKAEWDATQKLKRDPRITRVGRLLRKTSLDELPQLFNVLGGTMSLVGPRPMLVEQESLYGGKSYYRMRPGITGLWQVSDRNECRFSDRVHYDDRYHRDLSFRADVSILFRTVSVVLRGTGY